MIASLLLSLREGVEAALIIGIVLAVLGKTKQKELRASVWQGAVTAIVISIFAGVYRSWGANIRRHGNDHCRNISNMDDRLAETTIRLNGKKAGSRSQ
jgi:hypothetical protein